MSWRTYPHGKRQRLIGGQDGVGDSRTGGADAGGLSAACRTVTERGSGSSGFVSAFVHKRLEALGQDCVAAGRVLLDEGMVREQRGPSTLAGKHSADPHQRTFEVRDPVGSPSESVVLVLGVSDIDLLECSCWLRGHCKHAAAVLRAVERELRASNDTVATCLARTGDMGALRRRNELEMKLGRKTLEELKVYLRHNHQMLSGTKPELRRRVADGVVFGIVPPCPFCGGFLHVEGSADSLEAAYRCRRINMAGVPCGYEIEGPAIKRRAFVGAEQLIC